MSTHPFKGPAFRKLFAEWNRRLAEDGFQDAEDFSLPDPPLKSWHSFRFKENRETLGYYQRASSLLESKFTFGSDIARRVWELHAQGKSVRGIEETLRYQLIGYKGRKRDCVHRIIVEIQMRSGLKR